MNRADPFTGYSILLRTIIYGAVPAFLIFQYFRFRRALHVFQLEGYKRARFLEWCRRERSRAWFLRSTGEKKPLVMTGRAWRILVAALVMNLVAVLVLPGIAHISSGWPWDVLTWAVATALTFYFAPRLMVLADIVVSPIQKAINARYLRAARAKLDRIAPLVVGVTGSFGKTSTKFAIERLVGPEGTVLATPGSYNTPLGVCRTINERVTEDHKVLVVEMGAYGRGEIAELCHFTRPKIGVLTAIGPAHLERFGSMEAIRETKYEIVTTLPSDGVAVMNVDDPEVRALADITEHVRVVRYGLDGSAAPDVTAREVSTSPEGTTMTISARGDEVTVTTALLGRHAIGHVLAGVAVALEAGRSLDVLAAEIQKLAPVDHRLQIIKGTGGVTVIDDAYNSNPEGAAAAFEVLASMPANKRVIVTPGMVELGELQRDANELFGRRAAAAADVVIVVAALNREAIVAGAKAEGSAEVITVDSLDEAQVHLRRLLRAGDVVLFENDLPDQYEN